MPQTSTSPKESPQTDTAISETSSASTPQLFLDDDLIAKQENLERVLLKPKPHPSNPLMVQEHPWEKRTMQLYGTVLYDPESNKFRMWYMAGEDEAYRPEWYVCYAESPDGLKWNKPLVGTVKLRDYQIHNAVLIGGHGMSVLYEPDDPDPNRRYKALGGDMIAFSADGFHWKQEPFQPAQKNDTGSSVVKWNGEYLAYVRNQAYFGKRSIRPFIRDRLLPFKIVRESALSVSQDFQHWSVKNTVVSTFENLLEYPWKQPYGMSVTCYGDVLIAMVWMIDLEKGDDNYTIGDQYVRLAVSHDGRNWSWVTDDKFMKPSSHGWDSGRFYPCTTMISHDDKTWIYYTSSKAEHAVSFGDIGIGLATLPADRLAGLRPANTGQPGVLETIPITIGNRELIVNADVGNDGMQVEILSEKGQPVRGFEAEHSKWIRHDDLRYRIAWESNGTSHNLSSLSNRNKYRIRFILHSATLYAYQFAGAGTDFSLQQIASAIGHSRYRYHSSKSPSEWFETGLRRYEKAQYESAIEALNSAIELQSQFYQAYICRSLCYLRLHQNDLALRDANQAVMLEPNMYNVYYIRGLVQTMRADYRSAVEDFSKSIQLNPNDFKPYSGLGFAQYQSGSYQDALNTFNRSLAINPNDFFDLEDRGYAKLNLQLVDSAIEDFNRILENNKDFISAFYARANAYFMKQQYEQAINDLSVYIKHLDMKAEGWELRARIYYTINQFDKALADFQKVLELDPKNTQARFIMASIYMLKNQHELAVQTLMEETKRFPSKSHFLLACVYGHQLQSTTAENPKKELTDKLYRHLETALQAGFDRWDIINEDSNLEPVRNQPQFIQLIDRYKQ